VHACACVWGANIDWYLQTGHHSARNLLTILTYLLSACGFVKDIVHSNHLGKNGAIAEGVVQCSQPGCALCKYVWVHTNVEAMLWIIYVMANIQSSYIAQNDHLMCVSSGDNEEVDIYTE